VRDDSSEGEGVRRIGRYTLNGLTVLSLVLCVATVALWVRSASRAAWITYFWMESSKDHRLLQLESNSGRLTIDFKRGVDNPRWPERCLEFENALAYPFEEQVQDLNRSARISNI
jgi:hypothetical protein